MLFTFQDFEERVVQKNLCFNDKIPNFRSYDTENQSVFQKCREMDEEDYHTALVQRKLGLFWTI